MADILGLCWLSDSFIAVILDSPDLKDDSLYLFAVVKFSVCLIRDILTLTMRRFLHYCSFKM